MLSTALRVSFVRLPVLSMTLQGRAFILICQMRKRKPIKDFFSQEVAERHNLNPNNSDSNSALFYKPCCRHGNVSDKRSNKVRISTILKVACLKKRAQFERVNKIIVALWIAFSIMWKINFFPRWRIIGPHSKFPIKGIHIMWKALGNINSSRKCKISNKL